MPIRISAFAATLLAALAAFAGSAHPAPPNPHGPPGNLARALDASAALTRFFGGGGVYRDAYPASGPSSAWSFSQAIAATLALANVPGAGQRPRLQLRAQLRQLDRYWSAQGYMPYPRAPYGGGGSTYYDDNEWLGLDLVRAYEALRDPSYLERARQVFDVVAGAWDGNAADACPGGVWWTREPGNHDRNTVSTANGALLGLALYRATGQAAYLVWAQRMAGWVDRCLGAGDGLYWDHLRGDGTIDRREWSYNQGAMLAVDAGLFAATGGAAYRARATDIAQRSLAHFGAAFANEPSVFVAVFFRDLKALARIAPDPAYAAAAQWYADERWIGARNPANGLFGDRTLLDQAAAVDLYAELAASS